LWSFGAGWRTCRGERITVVEGDGVAVSMPGSNIDLLFLIPFSIHPFLIL
jgi:hypothetical protein